MIEKGSVKDELEKTEVQELTQSVDAKSLQVLGGHIQQIYYVIAAIMELFESDINSYYAKKQENPADVKTASAPIELLLEEYFIPFMIHYLKDLKSESISVLATPEMSEMMDKFEIKVNSGGFYELAKMNKEQYLLFRNLFIDERLHKEELLKNRNSNAMEILLRTFCMVMCKKLPTDIQFPANLHIRVHLSPVKIADKPLGAIVRLTIPQKKNPKVKEQKDDDAGSDAASAKSIPEYVEIDQQGKALAVNGFTASLPSRVCVIN